MPEGILGLMRKQAQALSIATGTLVQSLGGLDSIRASISTILTA